MASSRRSARRTLIFHGMVQMITKIHFTPQNMWFTRLCGFYKKRQSLVNHAFCVWKFNFACQSFKTTEIRRWAILELCGPAGSPNLAPRWPQATPSAKQFCLKLGGAQPKMVQKWPKMASRWPQVRLKKHWNHLGEIDILMFCVQIGPKMAQVGL